MHLICIKIRKDGWYSAVWSILNIHFVLGTVSQGAGDCVEDNLLLQMVGTSRDIEHRIFCNIQKYLNIFWIKNNEKLYKKYIMLLFSYHFITFLFHSFKL